MLRTACVRYAPNLKGVVEGEGAVYALFWSAQGGKIRPTQHYIAPARAAYLKEKRGDDKNFPSESYGTELAKGQSAIGRVWATGIGEIVSKPAYDTGFARQALALEFGINKITTEASEGGVLEVGFGPIADANLQGVVDAEGCAYAIFWSVKSGKITPSAHYISPARAAYLKSKRGDDKSFPSESYGTELAKNQSTIGRVWATGVAELVSKPGDDAGFARQGLAKEFGINKITAEAKYGGVLECGYGPTADE
jgi:hypothetical protein